MSRKNLIKESNKKLFESRLQMKPKSGIRNSQISFEYKRYSDNQSMLNNSQAYTKIIFQKQQKNNSILENSFLNNNNILNNSINKNIIKINNKNRNKTQNFNLNISQNKSNILIKDIAFFHLKKPTKNRNDQNNTIINVNKRIAKKNSNIKNKNISKRKHQRPKTNLLVGINLNIKKPKKANRNINLINLITRSMTTINESNNNITINNSNYIMNNTNININNINNCNDRLTLKEKVKPLFKITNKMLLKLSNRSYRTILNTNRKDSGTNKKFNRYNSFLMNKNQKIQKIKFGKKQNLNLNLNNTNFNTSLNEVIFGSSRNPKDRNGLNLFKNNLNNNKKTIDICKGFNKRNLLWIYLRKLLQKNNSIKCSNNNSRRKKLLNFEKWKNGYNSNKNLNHKSTNYLNKLFLCKEKKLKKGINKVEYNERKISRNLKNNKSTFNKKVLTYVNENSKKNLVNYSANNAISQINQLKDKDKLELISNNNINGVNTKLNEEFFSTEKNKKLNDSSIEEDSGILSMNEVQDIIHYNDMNDIRKEDKYLFNYNDNQLFIEKYKQKIYNIFF